MENPWSNNFRQRPQDSDSKLCPECGARNLIIASKCSVCGFNFHSNENHNNNVPPTERISYNENQENMRCPRCGNEIPYGSAFCPYCGLQCQQENPITPWAGGSVPGVEDPPQTGSLLKTILIASSIIVAACVIFFVMVRVGIKFPFIVHHDNSNGTVTSETIVPTQSASNKKTTPIPNTKTTQVPTAAPTSVATDTPTPVPTDTPTPVPTETPTPTPQPTDTPTPTPTPTPQPSTINPVNITDYSTGRLITVPNDTVSSQAYPDASTRYWNNSDVEGMTAGEVRYCINEIYARNGYIFNNENWYNYFMQKDWYNPRIAKADFNDSYLNQYEVANVKVLNEYYTRKKYPEY